MTRSFAAPAALFAFAVSMTPAKAETSARVEKASFVRPVASCLRAAPCRQAVADRMRALGVKIKERGWEITLHLAELFGEIAAAAERGYERAELFERLDRIERGLAAEGKLTPEISRELIAIRTRLGE